MWTFVCIGILKRKHCKLLLNDNHIYCNKSSAFNKRKQYLIEEGEIATLYSTNLSIKIISF